MEYVHKFVPSCDRWDSVPVRTPVEKATKLAQGWLTEMPVIEAPAPVEHEAIIVPDDHDMSGFTAGEIVSFEPKKRGRHRKDVN